ncbi:MAG: restriction endonuclease subunit S [Nitrospira sp.]
MIADLKPYPEYRESGLPWLGQVPGHWELSPLAGLARLKSVVNQPARQLLSVYLQRGVVRFTDVDEKRTNATSEDLSNYQAVDPGDFVLNNQQAWRGSVGVSDHSGIVSPAYLVLTLSKRYSARYANLLFRDMTMVSQYLVCSKGVGTIQRNLYWPHLKRVGVLVPPPDEQAAIVRFLDWANGRLERAIRAKRKVIALLNEQKQAIIHRAVTRGLDPSVPLKPSGIPWLGDIPKHWEVKRIKYLLREVDKRSATGSEPLLSMRMHHGLVLFAEHFSRPPQASTLVGFKIVHPGQFVVNRMQAGNGVIFASTLTGLVSPDYAVFDPIGDANVDFLGELFRSRKVRAKFRAESKGLGTGTSGFLRLYNDRLGAIHVALPPRAEQREIITGLSRELSGVNAAISRLEREIELLREYRTSLVADVVTGKLDVRAAAAKLPEEADNPEPLDDVDALTGADEETGGADLDIMPEEAAT